MGKQSLNARRWLGAVCAGVCGGVLGLEALATGYLPSTGPVPLRFEMEKPPSKPLVWPALILDEPSPAVTTNEPPSDAASVPMPAVAETNAAPVPAAAEVAPVTPAPDSAVALLDRLYGGDGANPHAIPAPQSPPEPGSEAPASNLLVVTPQMLVEYFKAGSAVGTSSNAPSTGVFAPVGFTPPAPVGLPSSQATYRTQ